jgi:outer membrane immunogenic protein
VTEQIIVGAQYRYYDFGSDDIDLPDPFSDITQDVDLHTVSLKASYKF